MRTSSLAFIATLLLTVAHTARAQIVCAPNRSMNLVDLSEAETPGLQLMSGTYRLVSAHAEDGTNPLVLTGLVTAGPDTGTIVLPPNPDGTPAPTLHHMFSGTERGSISFPRHIGHAGDHKEDKHGNEYWEYGHFTLQLVNPGPHMDVNEELRTARSSAWCTNTNNGSFYLRMGAAIDWRWKNDGDFFGINIFDKFPYDHQGATIHSRLAAPTNGALPVLRFTTDAGAATRAADDLYKRLKGKAAAHFYTYELELGGQLALYIYQLPQCWRRDHCYKDDGVTREEGSWTDTTFAYSRTLEGVLRHRYYLDPRVGVAGYEPSAMEYTFNVVFTANPIVVGNRKELEEYQKKFIIPFCGNPHGCGKRYASFAGQGARYLPGSDDAERLKQVCRAATHNDKECYSQENEQLPNMEPDAAYVDRAVNSGSGEGHVDEAQRRTSQTGQRRDAQGNTILTSSQMDRYCLRLLAADSVDVMLGPLPVNESRPMRYVPDLANFPTVCQAFLRDRYPVR